MSDTNSSSRAPSSSRATSRKLTARGSWGLDAFATAMENSRPPMDDFSKEAETWWAMKCASVEAQHQQLLTRMQELQTKQEAALGATSIAPKSVKALVALLTHSGVPIGTWPEGRMDQLFGTLNANMSVLRLSGGQMFVCCEPVVVRLHYGSFILVKSAEDDLGMSGDEILDERLPMKYKMLGEDETWERAAINCVKNEMRIDIGAHTAVNVVHHEYDYSEDIYPSVEYPGLMVRSRVHFVACRVTSFHDAERDDRLLKKFGIDRGVAGKFSRTRTVNGSEVTNWFRWLPESRAVRMQIKGLPETGIHRQTQRKQRQPPTGTGTIVFTDVEGSTEQWEVFPTAMARAIALHDKLLRASCHAHYGYEITTEGDAFMLAFYEPEDALSWALEIQRKLLFEVEWPPTLQDEEVRDARGTLLFRGLRVRVGMATGALSPFFDDVTKKTMYSGDAYDRARSISDLPSGGQVIMDADTFAAASLQLCNDGSGQTPRLVDEGIFHLVGQDCRVFQIISSDLVGRAQHWEPLPGAQSMTAYWHAPTAVQCPLFVDNPPDEFGAVTLAIIGIHKYPLLVTALGPNQATKARALFSACVKEVLRETNGYFCREHCDMLMAAFHETHEAVEFALQLQIRLLTCEWNDKLLLNPLAMSHSIDGKLVFKGLRAKVGVHRGYPRAVEPHPNTGRLEYSGGFAYLAGCLMAAAWGGQILLDKETFDEAKQSEGWASADAGDLAFETSLDTCSVVAVWGKNPAYPSARCFPNSPATQRSVRRREPATPPTPVPDELSEADQPDSSGSQNKIKLPSIHNNPFLQELREAGQKEMLEEMGTLAQIAATLTDSESESSDDFEQDLDSPGMDNSPSAVRRLRCRPAGRMDSGSEPSEHQPQASTRAKRGFNRASTAKLAALRAFQRQQSMV